MGKELTKAELDALLRYIPETGEFHWINKNNRRAAGDVAGTKSTDGYTAIRIGGKGYRAHRLAWLTMTGEVPPNQIDHINGLGRDNRWENLRLATPSQNQCNRKMDIRNKTGIKGLFLRDDGLWQAQVTICGKSIYLMTKIKAEAINWLKTKRAELHGAFSRD